MNQVGLANQVILSYKSRTGTISLPLHGGSSKVQTIPIRVMYAPLYNPEWPISSEMSEHLVCNATIPEKQGWGGLGNKRPNKK
jgi:hypothetical protein